MSKRRRTYKQERHIRIRGVRRDPPDLRKLAGAIIALAQAQAEVEAEAEAKKRLAANGHDDESNLKADDGVQP